jgi:hypothetical protein
LELESEVIDLFNVLQLGAHILFCLLPFADCRHLVCFSDFIICKGSAAKLDYKKSISGIATLY